MQWQKFIILSENLAWYFSYVFFFFFLTKTPLLFCEAAPSPSTSVQGAAELISPPSAPFFEQIFFAEPSATFPFFASFPSYRDVIEAAAAARKWE